jgi:CRISPR-associated endonuclease Cas2
MSTPHMHWICSYDICHPKRLKKVHQALSNQGIAINYSVFYLSLSLTDFKQLTKKIERLISTEDDVRFYKSMPLHRAVILGVLSPSGIQLLGSQGQLL